MILFNSKERYEYSDLDVQDIAKSIKTGSYKCTNVFEKENGSFNKKIRLYNNNNVKQSVLFLRDSFSCKKSVLGGNTKMYKYVKLGINYERDGNPSYVKSVENILYKYFNERDIGNLVKMSLPAFVSSVKEYNSYERGSFVIKNIKELSGYITIDVDHLVEVEELKKTIITNNKFVKFIFTSPRGDGLKIVCQYNTPIDILKYKNDGKLFKQLWDNVNKQVIDTINNGFYGEKIVEMDDDAKDINRLCFLSYDPNLLWRKDCVPLEIEYLEADDNVFYDDNDISNYIKEYKTRKSIKPVFLTNIADELSFLDAYVDWLMFSNVQPFGGKSNYTAFRNMGFGLIELVKKDEKYKNTILELFEKITSYDSYYGNHEPIGRFVETQFENFWNNNSEGITYASVKYYIKKQINEL